MSGDFFKVTKEFHACVEDSLAAVTSGEDKRSGRGKFKHITAVAASIAIVAIVTVFTAHAAGVINLNNNFKKLFGMEEDNKAQELVSQLVSYPDAQCVSNGITAKVIQSVNDKRNGMAMLEFTTDSNIFNPEMYPQFVEITVDGVAIGSGSPAFHDHWQERKKKTVEESKYESDHIDEIIANEPQVSEKELKKMLKESMDNYNKSFTNKYYYNIYFDADQDINGKTINVKIKNFYGYKNWYSTEAPTDILAEGEFHLSWQLINDTRSRTIELNKEINGIKVKKVILTPFSIEIFFDEKILTGYDEASGAFGTLEDEERLYKVQVRGVRYKDGTTEATYWGGGTQKSDYLSIVFDKQIIDMDNVTSIFWGHSYTEVPFD